MKKIQFSKKNVNLVCFILLLAIFLTACSKEQPLLDKADYELNTENNTTIKGIGIGDTAEDFLASYGEYDIEISINGGNYQSMAAEEIPFDEPMQTILPTFIIDDVPVTLSQICEENEIERSDLLTLLSSDEYLNEHQVSYYYLIFDWKSGAITDIRSDYIDFNKDAFYYEEIRKDAFDFEEINQSASDFEEMNQSTSDFEEISQGAQTGAN